MKIMKRLVSVFLCLLVLLPLLSICGTAQAVSTEPRLPFENAVAVSETTQELPDGIILKTVVYENSVVPYGVAFTTSGAVVKTAYNRDGTALFEFTLRGTFAVTAGLEARCIAATYEHAVFGSDWYFVSAETSRVDNKAFGAGTFKRKLLGIVVETRVCEVTLSCDAYGNMS